MLSIPSTTYIIASRRKWIAFRLPATASTYSTEAISSSSWWLMFIRKLPTVYQKGNSLTKLPRRSPAPDALLTNLIKVGSPLQPTSCNSELAGIAYATSRNKRFWSKYGKSPSTESELTAAARHKKACCYESSAGSETVTSYWKARLAAR